MGPEDLGYPASVLAGVALAGSILLALRPHLLVPLVWAALLTVDNTAYTFTRVGSGFFLVNLYDLLLVLGVLAGLRVREPSSHRALGLPAALGGLLAVGLLLTALDRSVTYEDMRLVRFALVFVLALVVGILTGGARPVRLLLWILVGAVGFQSLRQCVYVVLFPDPQAAEGAWRTLRFLNAGLAYVPIALSLAAERLPPWQRAALVVATVPAVVALVLTQTRSLWVPQAIVAAGLLLWRVPRGRNAVPVLVACVTAAAVIVGGRLFSGATDARIDLWVLFAEGRATDFSAGTGREAAIMAELAAWLEGNWLLGRGIGFQNGPGFDPTLAWGHNGYTGYLASLGLLGLVAYALLVPLAVVRPALALARRAVPAESLLGAVTLSTVAFCSLQSLLSSGLLAGHVYSLYGLLGGVAILRGRQAPPGVPGRASWPAGGWGRRHRTPAAGPGRTGT
jgi:hypothetical protein